MVLLKENNRSKVYGFLSGVLLGGLLAFFNCGEIASNQDLEKVQKEKTSENMVASKILVFTKTSGFTHGSISDGISMFQSYEASGEFSITQSSDAAVFEEVSFFDFDALVFLNTSGNILNETQEAAIEAFIQSGKGFLGVHAATDTEYGWAWYGGLVGAYFNNHPSIQDALLLISDVTEAATDFLPAPWDRRDEWYNFQDNPKDNNVHVLVSIDEDSYSGGNMGAEHPISWCHMYDGGRSWYTAMGHTSSTYQEAHFIKHVLEGLKWVAGRTESLGCASK